MYIERKKEIKMDEMFKEMLDEVGITEEDFENFKSKTPEIVEAVMSLNNSGSRLEEMQDELDKRRVDRQARANEIIMPIISSMYLEFMTSEEFADSFIIKGNSSVKREVFIRIDSAILDYLAIYKVANIALTDFGADKDEAAKFVNACCSFIRNHPLSQ